MENRAGPAAGLRTCNSTAAGRRHSRSHAWRRSAAIALTTSAIALATLYAERLGLAGALTLFASSVVTILAMPDSPAARASSVVVGHCVALVVSLCLVRTLGSAPAVVAAAIGLSVFVMMWLRRVHPPAAGTPLVIASSHEPLQLLALVVVCGCAVLSLIGIAQAHAGRESRRAGCKALCRRRLFQLRRRLSRRI